MTSRSGTLVLAGLGIVTRRVRRQAWLALSLALLLVPGLAHGLAFTNGSFESGINPGVFATLSSGNSTNITGWTVTANTIDYIGSYWVSADGARSLDMDGSSAKGAVSQTFDTVPATSYVVRFALAGNPDGGAPIKNLHVSAASNSTDYSFDTTGHNTTNMGWIEQTFLFLATASSTTLTFASLTPSDSFWGPAIDNVRVDAVDAAVPEPTTLLLFGTTLVGMAVAARRLRKSPPQEAQ